jgi:penicillin-binding protein 2
VIAEKYLTGEIKREHLYKKMVNATFMPEYKRQWVVELKRKGLYKEPSKDSLFLQNVETKLESAKTQAEKKQLLFQRDSIINTIKISSKR